VRTFYGQEGSSDADVRTFWCKNTGFFEIYGVPERTRGEGVEPVRTRGSIFRDFVRTLYGWPLTMQGGNTV